MPVLVLELVLLQLLLMLSSPSQNIGVDDRSQFDMTRR